MEILKIKLESISPIQASTSLFTSSLISPRSDNNDDQNDNDLADRVQLAQRKLYSNNDASRRANSTDGLPGDHTDGVDRGLNILYAVLVSTVFLVIILVTLIGNTLVILAVVIVRKLHTQDNANNFLIVSLAVSDLLVGVFAMPFAFYMEFSEDKK